MSIWKMGVVSAIGVWVAAEIAYVVYCKMTKKQKKQVMKGSSQPKKKKAIKLEKMKTIELTKTVEAPTTNNPDFSAIEELLKQNIPPHNDESCDVWNTVMFFPDYYSRRPVSVTRKLIWYLNQSQKAIKICMYVLRCRILEKALHEIAESKNILVMVVAGNGACLRSLRPHGIMARVKPTILNSSYSSDIFVDLMHNKFIILDDLAVISGSMNWTEPGVAENRENVVITNNQATVEKYVQRFEQLWDLSEPEPYGGKRGKRQNKTMKSISGTAELLK